MPNAHARANSELHPAGYRDLAPVAALDHLPNFRIVDVREPDEYVGPLGHIRDAELVPLATVVAAAEGWDRTQPLLMVCRSGARSGRAASALVQMGFTHVYNLMGGMLAWDANQLPRV